MDENSQPKFVRVRAAAEYLGVGRSTLYKLMDTGELGYMQVGGVRRIAMAELERFVSAHTKQAVA